MTPDEQPTAPAPAAPAPEAPQQPAQPTQPAAPTVAEAISPEPAIERASREARERIAELGTAVPPGPGEVQGRRADGKFAHRENVREVGATVPDTRNVDLEGEPATGRDTPAPPSSEATSEAELDTAGTQEAEAAQAGAEAEAAADAEGTKPEGEAPDSLIVHLPPRRDGEEPIPYELSTPEEADDFRRLINGYMRGEQARAVEQELQQEYQQVEEMREYALTDPAGFLLTISEQSFDPQQRAEVLSNIALHLITTPEVWQQIGERVMNFDDETERRAALVDAKEARQKMADAGQRAIAESRVVSENLRDVQNVITGLMDEGWDESAQSEFFEAAAIEVKKYAEDHNLMTVAPQRIPVILADVMAEFGLNPVEAAQRVAGARAGKTTARPTATKRPAATQPAPKSAPARRTAVRRVEDVQRASQQRRAAAALPGGGKGAPSSVPTPPAGMGIEEATEWHRKQYGAGRRLMNT